MIDYRNYHSSPLFISNKEGTDFEGLSFKTTRNIYHPYHFHDGVEIVYVHKGAVLVNAFSLTETVKEGQFIPCDPYLVHSVESMTADTVVTTISISGDYIDENDGIISSNIQMVADTEEYARLKDDILEWIMMGAMPDATTDKMLWQMKKIFPRLQKFMSVAFLDTKEDRIKMLDNLRKTTFNWEDNQSAANTEISSGQKYREAFHRPAPEINKTDIIGYGVDKPKLDTKPKSEPTFAQKLRAFANKTEGRWVIGTVAAAALIGVGCAFANRKDPKDEKVSDNLALIG